MQNTGTAILLNGPSSSGKTSISKELQKNLSEPFLIMSIDNFFCMSPEYFFKYDPWIYDTDISFSNDLMIPNSDDSFIKLMDNFPKIVSGFHHSIKSMLDCGNNLIIDHGFHKLCWLNECASLLKDNNVYAIKVTCDESILKKREMHRGDRPIGMALYQNSVVHRDVCYDFCVDTSLITPNENSSKIIEYINNNCPKGSII